MTNDIREGAGRRGEVKLDPERLARALHNTDKAWHGGLHDLDECPARGGVKRLLRWIVPDHIWRQHDDFVRVQRERIAACQAGVAMTTDPIQRFAMRVDRDAEVYALGVVTAVANRGRVPRPTPTSPWDRTL